jgi:hypothetical protein
VNVRFCDELGFALGWIAPEPAFMQRCSHALAVDGKVWLVDVVDGDGIDERIRELGEPAGVIQLVDRHERDCQALARRLQVPLHRVPFDVVPGSPFQPVTIVRTRFWKEIALWWQERQLLLCGDALGTAPFYLARGERLAVHPLLRLFPPQRLGGLEPAHVLSGHGEGVDEQASTALSEALSTSSRRAPRWFLEQAGSRLRGLLRRE